MSPVSRYNLSLAVKIYRRRGRMRLSSERQLKRQPACCFMPSPTAGGGSIVLVLTVRACMSESVHPSDEQLGDKHKLIQC